MNTTYYPDWNYRLNSREASSERTPYEFALLLLTVLVLALCFGIPFCCTFFQRGSRVESRPDTNQGGDDGEKERKEKQAKIDAHLALYRVILGTGKFDEASGKSAAAHLGSTPTTSDNEDSDSRNSSSSIDNDLEEGIQQNDRIDALTHECDPMQNAMVDLSMEMQVHLNVNGQEVAGCCAICLTSYEVGDVLVWSPNCTHAFHDDCIRGWFQSKKSELHCPFCRQCYVVEEAVDDVERAISAVVTDTAD